jgi:hypothetical protein
MVQFGILDCLVFLSGGQRQSSPGLLPMVAAVGLTNDQEGKEGGSSHFILRERGQ